MLRDLRDLLDVIGDHATATIVGSLLLIVGVIGGTLWLAGTSPTRDGAHEPIGELERQENAMSARIHAQREEVKHVGVDERWSWKQEMPPELPLARHIDVYELERIAEQEFEVAREKLGAARRAVARFDMERDAAALRAIETDTIKKVRWVGYDPGEATTEIHWRPEMAVRR